MAWVADVSAPDSHVVTVPGILGPALRPHAIHIVDWIWRLRLTFVVRKILVQRVMNTAMIVVITSVISLSPHPHVVVTPRILLVGFVV